MREPLAQRSPDIPHPQRHVRASPGSGARCLASGYRAAFEVQLSTLSGSERQALHLVEVEGASYDQTAAHLGLARDQVVALVCESRRKIFCRLQEPSREPVTPPRDGLPAHRLVV